MVTYDVEGYRTAFNNYLQNPSQYPEPNWANFVIATPTTPSAPSGGSSAIPAPHVDAITTGSDQEVAPSYQNIISETSKGKINTVLESKQQPETKTDIGIGKFGGEVGQYGNIAETVVAPAKIVTNVEPLNERVAPMIQKVEPLVGKSVQPTPQEIPVENKMQKVPLTQQQLKDIQTYTDSVTKSLTDAKATGAKTIEALVNGKVVDRFPVNDNTKEVLFAAIPELQKNYGSVTLGFTGAKTETTTTKKIPLTEDQVSQVHAYTENIVQTVQEAKATGAKNILVLDQGGKQIDSIPVGQDTTRILFAAVPNLQKEGKQITLSYTPQMKNVLPANYTPSYEEDVKTYGKEQVNPFTEIIKGSNEGIADLLNTGKAAAAYIWSGGKVLENPNVKGDILSNTITSPIKTTIDSSGKTTTTVSVENAKTGLSQVQSDIEKNPARQIGRLLPSIEAMIGTGLASEGVGVLAKGGSSAISKIISVSKDEQPFTSATVRQYPTYRATNMMRTKLPSDIFASDTAQESSFISKEVALGSGAVKTGGSFSDTGISLGRGSGGAPPTSTPKDFINAIKDLPIRPNKNAALPSYEFKPVDTEGGNTSTSGTQSLIQKVETKPQETVAKTIQKQLEENQKKVETLYGTKQETTTKTETKADQAMKEYNDMLTGRKTKKNQLVASEESYFISTGKVITVPKQEEMFKVDNIFEPLQKQVEDVITIPKQKQDQMIDIIEVPKTKTTQIWETPQKQTQIEIPIPKQETISIFEIPTDTTTIPKIPVPTRTTVPQIPIQETIPLEIPVPEEVPIPPDIFGGGGRPFEPQGGSTGGFENPRGSKKLLFVDYDVSEDPLGISKLGEAEYNPYGNKPAKITQVKVKTPTSKPLKLPKYSLKGMFSIPKKRKK